MIIISGHKSFGRSEALLNMDIIGRAEAKRRGLKRYFTGKPCKHGHVCERHVCGSCVECTSKSALARYHTQKNDPEYRRKRIEYKKEYRAKNPDKVAKYKKEYNRKNRDKLAEDGKKYAAKNRAKIKATFQAWIEKRGRKIRRRYARERRRADIDYRMQGVLRNRLYHALNGNLKTGSAVRDLGCSIPELKEHLESQFQPGMSWDNWSRDGWHIDHIIPFASFDLTDREQLKQACHWTNLQPLWAADNLSKGAKHPHD